MATKSEERKALEKIRKIDEDGDMLESFKTLRDAKKYATA